MDICEGRSENSAYVARGLNTRLQWRRAIPVRIAGCETDEQGLGVLGLAVTARDRQFGEETKVSGQRRRYLGGPQQFIY